MWHGTSANWLIFLLVSALCKRLPDSKTKPIRSRSLHSWDRITKLRSFLSPVGSRPFQQASKGLNKNATLNHKKATFRKETGNCFATWAGLVVETHMYLCPLPRSHSGR